MKPKTLIWVLVIIALIWLFVPVVLKIRRLETKKSDLEVQVQELSTRNVTLQNELRLLKSDPVYIEHVARKTFNKAKEGEVIYKLVPSEQTPQAAPASGGDN